MQKILKSGMPMILYCVMLCYVMLCYVMLCYVMLCYVMLCYVMLLRAIIDCTAVNLELKWHFSYAHLCMTSHFSELMFSRTIVTIGLIPKYRSYDIAYHYIIVPNK